MIKKLIKRNLYIYIINLLEINVNGDEITDDRLGNRNRVKTFWGMRDQRRDYRDAKGA